MVENVDSAHHLVRYVGKNRLRRDEDGRVIGLLPQAFFLRDNEQYLSSSHLEYQYGSYHQQIVMTIECFRTQLKVHKRDAFAIGNAGRIRSTCIASSQRIRLLHEPKDGQPAYIAVRNYRDDPELCELLATEGWAEFVISEHFE